MKFTNDSLGYYLETDDGVIVGGPQTRKKDLDAPGYHHPYCNYFVLPASECKWCDKYFANHPIEGLPRVKSQE